MSVEQFLVASLVILVGSTLQGTIGFGMGIFSAPLLILVEPTLVPGPMLMIGTVLMIIVLINDRVSLDLRGATWALVGRLPGSILGGALVALVSQSALSLFLAVIVLFGATATARGWVPPPTRMVLASAGAVSGVMGTATSVGAPPLALVWQAAGGPAMRATMSAFLLVGALMSLVALGIFGALTVGTVEAAASLLPAVALGFMLSLALRGHVDQQLLRRGAIAVSTLGAVTIIVQQLAGQ